MTIWNDHKTISNYVNIIRLSNNRGLMEYWNSCFTVFSKYTRVVKVLIFEMH